VSPLQILWRVARLWWRGLAFDDSRASKAAGPAKARAEACALAARGLAHVDFPRCAWFAAVGLWEALESSDRLEIARALALAAAIIGPLRAAWGDKLLANARAALGATAPKVIEGSVTVTEGHLRIFVGDWNGALACCEDGGALFKDEPTVPTWERNIARMGAMRAIEELGLFHRCRTQAAEWLADAVDRGDNYAEVTFALYGAMAELVAGETTVATGLLERCVALWQQPGFTVQHLYAARLRMFIDLYSGRVAEAWSAARAIWPEVKRNRFLSVPITRLDSYVFRGRVAVAALNVDEKAARSVARACIQALAKESRADAIGSSRLISAALLARGGDQRAAIDAIADAEAKFEACGMEAMKLVCELRRAELAFPAHDGSREEAMARLRERGVGDPGRLAQVLAPGF